MGPPSRLGNNSTDAKARKDYIRTITKSIQALAEYDYVHGSVLIRVLQHLTPTQAEVNEAAASLGRAVSCRLYTRTDP